MGRTIPTATGAFNDGQFSASVQGTVVEQTTSGADAHTDKMAKKYLGLDKYPGRMPGEKRIILKIKPESVFYQDPQRR